MASPKFVCCAALFLSACASQPANNMTRDEVLASRLVGTWDCSLVQESSEGTLKLESQDQYMATGAANSFGSMSVTVPELGETIEFIASLSGTWEIVDGDLIVTAEDFKVKNVSHPEFDAVFDMNEMVPKGLSDSTSIRVLTSEALVLGINKNTSPINCSRIDG